MAARNTFLRGIVVRTSLVELKDAKAWLASLQINPQDADLVVDCGHIADIAPQLMAQLVINTFQQSRVAKCPNLVAFKPFRLQPAQRN
jgi:hypothetical protein